jgi:hypothetical protein
MMPVLTPREEPGQSRLWVYQLKLHVTEEAQGDLNCPHISLSSVMRNLRGPWKSWVSKFYFLLTQRHIILFSLLLQEGLPLR